MQILAILASVDFKNLLLNNKERTIGGAASVIKNILDYLNFKTIILLGVTHKKKHYTKRYPLHQTLNSSQLFLFQKIIFFPGRLYVFFKSKVISKYIKKYKVDVVYSHSMEMSYWIAEKSFLVQHNAWCR
jgi:hypothetical protein